MRHLSLLFKFMAVHLKTMVQYRTDFFMGGVSQIVYTLLSVAFVDAFMSPGTTMQGWSFWQVIFLFGFGDLAFGLSAVFLFRIFLSFEYAYILQGRLDQLLTQPIPALYALILRNIDLNHTAIILKGLLIIGVSSKMIGLEWPAMRVLAFTVLAACGAIVYGGIYLAFVSLGFWFRRRSSLALPMLSLNYLIQYPLSIYPGPVQVFLSFIVPVGLATFYPAQRFLGLDSAQAVFSFQFWMLPLFASAIMGVGILLFHLGLRSYASSGT